MSFVRPELASAFLRWREVAAAVGLGLFGAVLMRAGGWILWPFGGVLALVAAGWAIIALRRMRFVRRVIAPGVVEVDEGQVGYFGPTFGGFVALADLVELRLTDFHGARQWRLRTRSGEILTIPLDAAGAEKLYDAFAALPGIDMAAVTSALGRRTTTPTLWKRHEPMLPGMRTDHEKS
ncbi:MAG: hypothetical protein R3E44_03230 [Paracoccaceae bacterium]